MNYVVEINEFYDWLEINDCPKAAISLWHALMNVANKKFWPKSFTVAMSTLESKTRFKRSELFKARNYLQQKGVIKWKERGGNLAADYTLIPFANAPCVHTVDTSVDANGNTNGNTVRTQTVTINKQKLKTETIDSVSDETSEGLNTGLFSPEPGETHPDTQPEPEKPKQPRSKSRQTTPKEPLILPFSSEAFASAWERYKKYRKDQHRFAYKSVDSERARLKELYDKSDQDERTAIAMIDQTIAKVWIDFYPLKNLLPHQKPSHAATLSTEDSTQRLREKAFKQQAEDAQWRGVSAG